MSKASHQYLGSAIFHRPNSARLRLAGDSVTLSPDEATPPPRTDPCSDRAMDSQGAYYAIFGDRLGGGAIPFERERPVFANRAPEISARMIGISARSEIPFCAFHFLRNWRGKHRFNDVARLRQGIFRSQPVQSGSFATCALISGENHSSFRHRSVFIVCIE